MVARLGQGRPQHRALQNKRARQFANLAGCRYSSAVKTERGISSTRSAKSNNAAAPDFFSARKPAVLLRVQTRWTAINDLLVVTERWRTLGLLLLGEFLQSLSGFFHVFHRELAGFDQLG